VCYGRERPYKAEVTDSNPVFSIWEISGLKAFSVQLY
jgi:hypothetical protein